MTVFRIALPVPCRSLSPDGIVATNSMRTWSSRGTRASSDTSMLARSTLVRMSSGRYVRTSRYWRLET